MILVGLTGSIGMGKSTTAQMFRDEGVPVYDADAAVHALYAKGGAAVEAVGALVSGAVEEGAVNRDALRKAAYNDPDLIPKLEAITHPLVAKAREAFIAEQDADIVVLDIPLLFETGGDQRVDNIVVVTAPPDVQRERVLSRPDMTDDRFKAILAKQTPDAEKRARADFVIDTSRGMDAARNYVRAILETLRSHND